jgi:hypothetical protein
MASVASPHHGATEYSIQRKRKCSMAQSPSEPEPPDLIPRCPECGEPARGTLEIVQGVALVAADPDTGRPVYAGDTEMYWDSQRTVEREGKFVWVCSCGHDWPVDLIPE